MQNKMGAILIWQNLCLLAGNYTRSSWPERGRKGRGVRARPLALRTPRTGFSSPLVQRTPPPAKTGFSTTSWCAAARG